MSSGWKAAPARFWFRHPIVHRAVYDSAPAGWRLGAHARAAAARASRGASLASQAPHVAICATSGDQRAMDLLLDAAQEVRAQAPPSAARWLTVAVDLMPSGNAAAAARTGALRALAETRDACGDLLGALRALEEVLTLLAPVSPGRVTAVVAAASIEHGLGRFDAARTRLVRALAVDPAAPVDRSALEMELAFADLFVLDLPCATRRARAVAEATTEGPIHAAALAFGCFVACCADDLVTGASECHRAATAVDRLSSDNPAERAAGAYYLGAAEYLLGSYHDACRHLDMVIIAGAGGNRQLIPARKDRARALAALGRLTEAAWLAEAAVETARLASTTWLTAFALAAQTEVVTAVGDLAEAQEAAEQAAHLTPPEARYFRAGIDRQLALTSSISKPAASTGLVRSSRPLGLLTLRLSSPEPAVWCTRLTPASSWPLATSTPPGTPPIKQCEPRSVASYRSP